MHGIPLMIVGMRRAARFVALCVVVVSPLAEAVVSCAISLAACE
jgi:hypothetical protein